MNLRSGDDRLNILYTNIGRGHPFYLDGIIEFLIKKQRIKIIQHNTDVFSLSHGLSLLAWKTAQLMYSKGSSPGIFSLLYRIIRSGRKYTGDTWLEKRLRRDIKKYYKKYSNPILVAHPLLVGLLNEQNIILYQHGELVAPEESLVAGAEYVFVPTDIVAEKFYKVGYDMNRVIVTGLCIEPSLTKNAYDNYLARTERILNYKSLTGAFFSSGAEPSKHINLLSLSALSAVKAGGRVILFAKIGGKMESKIKKVFLKSSVEFKTINSTDFIPQDDMNALLVLFQSRREENLLTEQLFSRFDYLVSPAHERSNWAVGLGLPLFVVKPNIGPFAPLNCELLHKEGVSEEIEQIIDANLFGTRLERYQKTGKLFSMAQDGWNKFNINGFSNIADFLINKFK